MKLTIPELSIVVLIGVSGSGKSTFARKHFRPTEILSSDDCRAMVSDDENSQAATKDAFELLQFIARKRLAAGRLTVVDATNVQPESREPFVQIAREFHCLPVAIVLDVPERVAHDRNKTRSGRDFGPHVIRQQSQQLHRSLRGLEIEAAVIERQPLWNNLKHERGPFDIIGDVHGCFDELLELLGKLGYEFGVPALAGHALDRAQALDSTNALPPEGGTPNFHHPQGRKLIFVGDLVDRGPKIPQVLKLAMNAVASGAALCVPGNHDVKLMRKLRGCDVQITHGLAESLAQLASEPEDFLKRIAEFIDDLVSHYMLDDGKLVVAHAGMKESMPGRGSGAVREFALFGETTGETDEFGLSVRYNWVAEYRGTARGGSVSEYLFTRRRFETPACNPIPRTRGSLQWAHGRSDWVEPRAGLHPLDSPIFPPRIPQNLSLPDSEPRADRSCSAERKGKFLAVMTTKPVPRPPLALSFAPGREIGEVLFLPGVDFVHKELADRLAVARVNLEEREQIGVTKRCDEHSKRRVFFADHFPNSFDRSGLFECNSVNPLRHSLERIGPLARFQRTSPVGAGFKMLEKGLTTKACAVPEGVRFN